MIKDIKLRKFSSLAIDMLLLAKAMVRKRDLTG